MSRGNETNLLTSPSTKRSFVRDVLVKLLTPLTKLKVSNKTSFCNTSGCQMSGLNVKICQSNKNKFLFGHPKKQNIYSKNVKSKMKCPVRCVRRCQYQERSNKSSAFVRNYLDFFYFKTISDKSTEMSLF